MSPLEDISNARNFNHVITESASGELRINTIVVSDKTDRDNQSHQTRVKIADQSNATSTPGRDNSTGQPIDQDRSIQQAEPTRATEAVDMVKVKPEPLRGDSSDVQKPSKNNKPQNVKSGGWKKWAAPKELATQPKNHPQDSKAKTPRKSKAKISQNPKAKTPQDSKAKTRQNTKASGDTLILKKTKSWGQTTMKIFVPARGDQ